VANQVPALRTCGYCRGTGRRAEFDCLACKGAGLVWVPVPDAGYPDSEWLRHPDLDGDGLTG